MGHKKSRSVGVHCNVWLCLPCLPNYFQLANRPDCADARPRLETLRAHRQQRQIGDDIDAKPSRQNAKGATITPDFLPSRSRALSDGELFSGLY